MPQPTETPTSAGSRPVTSDQNAVHPQLETRLRRHLVHAHRKPPHSGSVAAFEHAVRWLASRSVSGLILDTGCGTGASSRAIAVARPECAVIGIDKSAVRLGRGERLEQPGNLLLLRANLLDFYPLARAAGWRCDAQYALYPNPWPKAAALNKRWHGSPIFPDMVALGGELEVRSNWRLYLDEMRAALALFGVSAAVERIEPETPLSRFEAKYQASGHALWQLRAVLDGARWSDHQ